MNQKPHLVRTQILHALCEGVSQRSCERIFGVSQNTVAKLHAEVGDWAIAHIASIRDLEIRKIQADELYAFVAAKKKAVADMLKPPEGAGTVWTYLGMEVQSTFILEYHLGSQDKPDATKFMRKLAAKLKRQADGKFAVRPHLSTDGLIAYGEAVERAFGDDVDFGVFSKQYSKVDRKGNKAPGARYIGAERVSMSGEPNRPDINTSYIERQNLNLRMGNRRFTRKTNGFSKTMLNHERSIALWIVYHNYCWVPRPRRPRPGPDGQSQGGWSKRLPAAIAIGLETRLWDVEDMLIQADIYTALCRGEEPPPQWARDERPDTAQIEANASLVVPTHYVYFSHIHRTTKVHTAGCSNCRDGQGKRGGVQKSGEWLPYYSLEAAIAAADRLQPDASSICNMCLGEYFKRGY